MHWRKPGAPPVWRPPARRRRAGGAGPSPSAAAPLPGRAAASCPAFNAVVISNSRSSRVLHCTKCAIPASAPPPAHPAAHQGQEGDLRSMARPTTNTNASAESFTMRGRHAAAATAAHPAPSQSSTAFAWQSVWSTCNHSLCFPASLMPGALRMTALYDKVRWAARFHTALAPKAALGTCRH